MEKEYKKTNKERLLSDQSLAELLDVSVQWVRQDRCNRKYGRGHALDVDQIQIGRTKRYKLSDIEAWIEKQKPEVVDV